jgi:hypothetical protein
MYENAARRGGQARRRRAPGAVPARAMWFPGAGGEDDGRGGGGGARRLQRSLSPSGARSPRAVSLLDTIPLVSGLMGGSKTMELAVLNAATLLEGRVDPNLAAIDQAIPTWVIAKAKARRACVSRRAALRVCGAVGRE